MQSSQLIFDTLSNALIKFVLIVFFSVEQLAAALASGEGLQMEGEDAQEEADGNRVFTLSVGKGGDGAKAQPIQQVPPMPEPLTEHDGE